MNLPKATYDQQTRPMQSHLNVGYGSDISIAQIAHTVATVVGYPGKIDFDRPARFVTRKIVDSAVRIANGSDEKLARGRLNIVRDWGWAPEYVDAKWRMLQQEVPASGKCVSRLGGAYKDAGARQVIGRGRA